MTFTKETAALRYQFEIENYCETQFLDENFDELFDLFADEMPYGVQKAREGCPFEWLDNRLKA